jgi:sRNA-binding carbon storage regulator CsrA
MKTTDEMDDLYSGGEPTQPKGPSIDDQEQQEMQETADVPVSLLNPHDGKGVKEGDEIVVKVVAVHGDTATIAYAPKEGAEHEPETMAEGQSPDEEIDSLSDKY